MITRRGAIAGLGAAVVARGAPVRAQVRRVPRIGVVGATPPPDVASTDAKAALERGLQDLGWKPGVDIVIDYRYASGSVERMRAATVELVRRGVDVIVARGTQATRTAREAGGTIPIVMSFVADPVGAGFIRSLARPGGTITGVSFLVQALQGKQLELLKEAVPVLARVAVLGNSTSVTASQHQLYVKAVESGAAALGLRYQIFDVRDIDDIPRAFASIAAARFGGLLLFTDPFLLEPSRLQVVGLAARYRLPAMYPWRHYVDSGGLAAYGASQYELHRRAAAYVDRILKGAAPADLPVEQPTAKALGLTIAQSVLIRADAVID